MKIFLKEEEMSHCIYLSDGTRVCKKNESDGSSVSNLNDSNNTNNTNNTKNTNNLIAATNVNNNELNDSNQNVPLKTQEFVSSPCESVSWFRNTEDVRSRADKDRGLCEAIYNITDQEEKMSDLNYFSSEEKYQACQEKFSWFDRDVDSTFPSNGCYRRITYEDARASNMQNEDASKIQKVQKMQKMQKIQKQNTQQKKQLYENGGYSCNVEKYDGCLRNNEAFFDENKARQACYETEGCKRVMKFEDRFYLRRADDILDYANASHFNV